MRGGGGKRGGVEDGGHVAVAGCNRREHDAQLVEHARRHHQAVRQLPLLVRFVRPYDLRQRHVAVAETGLRVRLAHGQRNRAVRARVDAGQACVAALAAKRVAHGRAILHANAAARANLRVDAQEIPQVSGFKRNSTAHELRVRLAIGVAHRLDPAAAGRHVFADTCKVLADVLLRLYNALLAHVEVRQPIVHHQQRRNVRRVDAHLAHLLLSNFNSVGMAATIRQHQVEIRRVELRALDEFAHPVRHHMPVDGIHDTDGLARIRKLARAAHLLRNAAHLVAQLFGQLISNKAAIARCREIENHARLVLSSFISPEAPAPQNSACPGVRFQSLQSYRGRPPAQATMAASASTTTLFSSASVRFAGSDAAVVSGCE